MATIISNSVSAKMPTKKEMFEGIKSKYPLTVEEIAFIDHEVELLTPKKTKKEVAEAEANANLRSDILNYLSENPTQVFNRNEIADKFKITPSKVTAQMGVLVGEGTVTKYKGKNAEGKSCVCYGIRHD